MKLETIKKEFQIYKHCQQIYQNMGYQRRKYSHKVNHPIVYGQ